MINNFGLSNININDPTTKRITTIATTVDIGPISNINFDPIAYNKVANANGNSNTNAIANNGMNNLNNSNNFNNLNTNANNLLNDGTNSSNSDFLNNSNTCENFNSIRAAGVRGTGLQYFKSD